MLWLTGLRVLRRNKWSRILTRFWGAWCARTRLFQNLSSVRFRAIWKLHLTERMIIWCWLSRGTITRVWGIRSRISWLWRILMCRRGRLLVLVSMSRPSSLVHASKTRWSYSAETPSQRTSLLNFLQSRTAHPLIHAKTYKRSSLPAILLI